MDQTAKPKKREWNREKTTRDILDSARVEFVEYGLEAARMDRVAKRAGANKRLIYEYVGSKTELYTAVLLEAYQDIRAAERKLDLGALPPYDAMAKLVGFTFDHFHANPWFLRLLATENIQRARFVAEMPELKEMNSPIIGQIRHVLAEGEAAGVFRGGVDPVQMYITIAGLSYFFFSNIHTLSVVFDASLNSEVGLAERRAHAVDVAMSYLSFKTVARK
ncbi:TetR family transcriptional regulator [Vannielia litorea]|uniref:TetR/AcrR family transcriptional regulator n=1 Tax=Vannielia TaxID=2813041 RepID=UPI001C939A8F|nr:TetR/AcrR family transcriptional regulator [Vannielia litorea]MBY6048445.1 TetR family transcriptional regulator [Vannielia litorea]MBY6075859.1 TetR family transcriptional regulator [Vannielia litorea]MBY6151638.1 TetR family transcriptional regulator [Vannielia litorea]